MIYGNNLYIERKKVLSLEHGERTLNVLSLNPDSMNRGFINDCTHKMRQKQIHAACIQETRLNKDVDYRTQDGFRVISCKAITRNGPPEAGVAIILHSDIAGMVRNIIRHNERVLQVTLQNDKNDIVLNLFSIYAPRNGHR